MTELIYCAAGNERFKNIAVRYGLRYGAQLPATVYQSPYFADQDWRNPDRAKYMAALEVYQPEIATVLDLERDEQFSDVMAWAFEAAQHVKQAVIIIPKAQGIVSRIPEFIAGKSIRLGYSVPTKYAGTSVPSWEFGRRPVHLLGGSPKEQLRLRRYFNVASIDGNYINKMAVEYNQFFSAGKHAGNNGNYPRLDKVYGKVTADAPYLAFELSCMNLRAAWAGCEASIRFAIEDDLPHIKKLANQYKQELGFVMLPALRESMARRSLIVATYAGRVVGFVNYRACRDGWQTIYEIAVDRARRGEHIGAGLLAAVPQPIRLKCTTDNQTNQFYEAQGFNHAGVEEGRKRRLNLWQLKA